MAKEVKEVVTDLDENTGEVVAEVVETEAENESEEMEINPNSLEFIPTGLTVFRKSYKKDGKTRYSYHTSRKQRRGEIKCDWVPCDLGGYEQLDMVFFEKDINTELPLYVVHNSFKDSKGKTVNTHAYYVRDYDEVDRIYYMARIKPSEISDKGNLETLLDIASRE